MLTVGPAGPLKVAGPLGICPPPPLPPSRRAWRWWLLIRDYERRVTENSRQMRTSEKRAKENCASMNAYRYVA